MDDEQFCANPRCQLHCAAGDPFVRGRGEWATLADGRTYARTLVKGRYYCHVCAIDPEQAPGVGQRAADQASTDQSLTRD